MKGFIVIHGMEKGVSISEYSKEEFEEEAAKGEDGYIGKNPKFLGKLNKGMIFSADDLRDGEMIVIKGEIVVPKAVKVIKSYELED